MDPPGGQGKGSILRGSWDLVARVIGFPFFFGFEGFLGLVRGLGMFLVWGLGV